MYTKVSVECSNCSKRTIINKGDYEYMRMFHRVLCTDCLDNTNKELFYGKEE